VKKLILPLILLISALCGAVTVGLDSSPVYTDTIYHMLTFEEAIAGLQSTISGQSGIILRMETVYCFSWQYGDNIAFAFLDTAKGALVFKDWNMFLQELFPRATASVRSAGEMYDMLLNVGYEQIDAGELPMKIVNAVNAAANYMVHAGPKMFPSFILCPVSAFDTPKILQLEPERT
jgi:hypothetical protein